MKAKELKQYLKRSDIQIEGNVATWQCMLQGAVQGTYSGLFKFKCFLSPTEKLASGRLYRELLGPNAALAFKNEDNLAFSLAQLKYRVLDSPPFWSSAIGVNGIEGDIPDENVIDTILDASVAAELKYMAQLEERKKEAITRAKKVAERLLTQKVGDGSDEEEDGESTP
jgi:hypothetical protein